MDQDVALGVTMTITQADLALLRESGRLGEYPVVYRVQRMQQGGGYGDPAKHPYAWGILVYVDTQLARVNSARGFGREWNDLEKVQSWLKSQGFWYWWTRNDLEVIGGYDDDDADGAEAEENNMLSGPENHIEKQQNKMGEIAPMPKKKYSIK